MMTATHRERADKAINAPDDSSYAFGQISSKQNFRLCTNIRRCIAHSQRALEKGMFSKQRFLQMRPLSSIEEISEFNSKF
ncbi:hypothetical protein [Hyphomicrobium sp. 99]|uniref:hypothetical protein n=1 Tax=Hyphomicrobium sp. 99 TaxID=1163419 RepID=UPI0005F88507|nr:hypothetical protein [Hyphomicrobium sp. 99]